jgi:hypothetical protein
MIVAQLDPAAFAAAVLAAAPAPGDPRLDVEVADAEGHRIAVSLAPKQISKVLSLIKEHGVGAVSLRLECRPDARPSLLANVKAAKPEPPIGGGRAVLETSTED